MVGNGVPLAAAGAGQGAQDRREDGRDAWEAGRQRKQSANGCEDAGDGNGRNLQNRPAASGGGQPYVAVIAANRLGTCLGASTWRLLFLKKKFTTPVILHFLGCLKP
jgi:hypothetical protein